MRRPRESTTGAKRRCGDGRSRDGRRHPRRRRATRARARDGRSQSGRPGHRRNVRSEHGSPVRSSRAPCEASCPSERIPARQPVVSRTRRSSSRPSAGGPARRASCCAVPAKRRALIGPPPGIFIPRFTTPENPSIRENYLRSRQKVTKNRREGVGFLRNRTQPPTTRSTRLTAQHLPFPPRSIRTVTDPNRHRPVAGASARTSVTPLGFEPPPPASPRESLSRW